MGWKGRKRGGGVCANKEGYGGDWMGERGEGRGKGAREQRVEKGEKERAEFKVEVKEGEGGVTGGWEEKWER